MKELKDCTIVFERFERFTQGDLVRAHFQAKDLYDVMHMVVKHLGLFIDEDIFEKPDDSWDEEELECNVWVPEDATQEQRDEKAKLVLDKIIGYNGDGCDCIFLLEFDGKEYIRYAKELYIEEEW